MTRSRVGTSVISRFFSVKRQKHELWVSLRNHVKFTFHVHTKLGCLAGIFLDISLVSDLQNFLHQSRHASGSEPHPTSSARISPKPVRLLVSKSVLCGFLLDHEISQFKFGSLSFQFVIRIGVIRIGSFLCSFQGFLSLKGVGQTATIRTRKFENFPVLCLSKMPNSDFRLL